MRKKPNKVILFERLDLRKIKASMPERDWRRLEEICVTYNMDVNKLVAWLIKEYVHSADGEVRFGRVQKPESD